MQPEMPLPSHNPYDFILNSGQPQQPSRLPRMPSNKNSQTQRIAFVGLGGLVLLIVGVIVFNLIASSGKSSITLVKNLAAEQAEIIRIADLGVTSAKSSDARNLAATTALTVRTMQQRTTKLLSLKGSEVSAKDLAAKRNDKTDAALKTAEQNNRYDEAFVEYMNSELAKFQGLIKAAYDANTGTNDREVLGSSFTSASLILENQLSN